MSAWNNNHKTMVLLGVTPKQLEEYEKALSASGVPFRTFVEPDMGGVKTAMAILPTDNRKPFRKLRLYGGG